MSEGNSSFDSFKKSMQEVYDELQSGANLNAHQKAARDAIRIEREYYYGDKNNNKKLEQIRDLLNVAFNESRE